MLDAVVGSVSSGVNVRIVSDIPNLKYKEIRLMPYFFPDTLNDDEKSTNVLNRNWVIERRAMMRKPVDRIKAFSSNIYTECHYYPEHKTYAIVNNSAETQSTVFYDIDGKSREVEIEASGILWIK